MNPALPAQAAAQLASLAILIAAARWYAVPWLNSRPRPSALTALLWVQVFRYVALQIYSAQHNGFPISPAGAREIVLGDVGGAAIAFVAILLLRRQSRLAIPLAWLLVAETAYDTVANIRWGMREHLMGAASGVTWMILAYFVPLVIVSAGLIAMQLLARRREPFGTAGERSSTALPPRPQPAREGQ
jgi:hypothetical protein